MKKIGIGAIIVGALLVINGAIAESREPATIAVIGGADGPTSIFVAGDTLSFAAGVGIAICVILLILGAIAIWKKRK